MPVSQAETLNFFLKPFLVLHLTLEYSCSYVFIKMAKPKTKLQLLAEKAIQGDEQALEYLQIEEINVVSNMSSSISWQTLCANYNYLAHMLVVATKLKWPPPSPSSSWLSISLRYWMTFLPTI